MNLLADAMRPVLFIGHGATLSEAGPELAQLQKTYGIPVITSPNGMGCVPADDPLTLGFIGRNGAYPANQAGRHADLVLTIGTRFDDRSSSSWHPGYSWNFPKTKLIHVDLDPQELGRNYPPTLGIIADAKVFTAQLLGALGLREQRGAAQLHHQYSEWRAEVAAWRAEWEALRAPEFRQARPRRCGPSTSSTRCRRCCPTTRSSPAIPACTTTGSCSSGSRSARRAC